MPTLVVQMGHSGRTSGATGAPGEMAFTEAAGAACVRMLDGRGGWSVRLIRADVASSSYRGDGFVAIHADGSTNPGVRGACYGCQTPEGGQVGLRWADAWERTYGGPWHPVNYTTNLAQYYGVRNAVAVGNRQAFILEAGTITNAEDRALITSEEGLTALARSVGAAFGIPVLEVPTLTCAFNPDGDRKLLQSVNARATTMLTMDVASDAGEGDPGGLVPNALASHLRMMDEKLDAILAAVTGSPLVPRGSITFERQA